MRIGAQLEFADGPRDLLRVKRKESLLDAQERPISDAALNQELGGIEREAYCLMFSLDDKSLERGGQSILASQGELGRLLFSASAGLSDLSRALQSIREHSEAFYKPRGRTHQLSELKNKLADLKNERERLDMVVSEYRFLVEERDRAEQQYNSAQKERAAKVARRDEIQRQLTTFPKLGVLRETRRRLEGLSGIPEPPAAWAEELDTLRKQDIQAQVKEEAISNEIDRLKIIIGGLEIDTRSESMAAEVERLKELRARFMSAEKDLPGRKISLREADAKIDSIMMRIERERGEESCAPDSWCVCKRVAAAIDGTVVRNRSGISTCRGRVGYSSNESRDRAFETRRRRLGSHRREQPADFQIGNRS